MIDLQEFTAIIGTIIGATQRPLDAVSIKVYHDLLSDIPKEVLEVAVRRVACEWNDRFMFPPVGVIREAAAQTMAGNITDLSQAEAWKLALKAVQRFSLEGRSKGLESLPAVVREAADAFGWQALCDTKQEDIHVARAQFMRMFQTLQDRERRTALLPAAVKEKIEAIGNGADRPRIEDLTRRIGNNGTNGTHLRGDRQTS